MSEVFRPHPRLPRADVEVGERLRHLADGDAIAESDVQHVVCGYVRALRDAGALPEEMLVALKAEFVDAGLSAARRQESRVSVEQIVSWCIAEYYRAE